MHLSLLVTHLINGALGTHVLLAVVIIIGTFVLEDPTTVIVGVLASDGLISIPLALGSLYAGVVLGDIGFYYLGRYARTHRRFERYVDHDYAVPIRAWLESRFTLTIFSARFIPGSRLPTYAATGFFQFPFSRFIWVVVVAASIWTTFLFGICYWFGSVTGEWLDGQRWTIAIVFVLTLFLVARHNLRSLQASKTAKDIAV